MGMIRNTGSIFLFFLAFNLSSQTIYDTTYFSGKRFVEHVVKVGESLKSIALLHKVTTSDIKDANELERRLFFNQLLYIPIYLNDTDEKLISFKELIFENDRFDSSITNIALLMPYYLIRNDTMFNQDTLDASKRYYNKSEAALSFHVGVELAIDSLRRAGKKIILHTFDTNQNSVEVKRIISSGKLDEMDIIIGPMYSSLFQMICQSYGQDDTKKLISPLSRENKGITQFPSVYQIALTYRVQAELLTKYLIANKLAERIIILSDTKEKGLVAYLKYNFEQQNKTVESFEIIHTKVDSIREFFVEEQNVLLLSKDKAFISTILGSIGSIDSVSNVFTFESVTSYYNLDITNLMELNVHIPNSRSIDYSNKHDLNFISLFEKEYTTNPRKYSKEGYDIIMHFCGNANQYYFKQSPANGYYENVLAPLYHYLDYELVPVR